MRNLIQMSIGVQSGALWTILGRIDEATFPAFIDGLGASQGLGFLGFRPPAFSVRTSQLPCYAARNVLFTILPHLRSGIAGVFSGSISNKNGRPGDFWQVRL